MPHACPSFRLGLVLSLLLGLLVGAATPVQAADGDLFSWGNNDFGQLGDGTNDDQWFPVSVTPDFPDEVVAVAGGLRHSLALLADGTVWAWGWDGNGQLGNGDAAGNSPVPTQVSGLPPITAISAGGYHSVALDDDGNVWTWGYNDFGQLGIDSFDDAQLPVDVPSLSDVVDIAAGYFHTLALTGNGTVYAWGDNGLGQLGIGSDVNQSTPVEVESLSDAEIVNVVSGPAADVSLAITADGTLYEWGANLSGKGTRFTPVQVAGISDVVDASAGNWHVLALTADGTVYGWGSNLYNGSGGTGVTDTPQWVMDDAVAVATGAFHSLVIDDQGTLWSWGRNRYGQLGTGTNDDESIPVVVQTSLRFRAVAAGHYHNLAIEADLTPPTTTATINDEAPNADWYQSATVALTANEPATTTYDVNGGPIQPYTSPFVLPDGIHTVTYRSADLAENVEDDQTLTVRVDGTNPTIQPIQSQTLDPVSPAGAPVFFTPIVADLLTPTDDLLVTCVDQFDNPFVSGQYASPGTLTTITCTVTDLAGNTASTIFTVEVSGSSDLFDELRGMITGLNLPGSTGQTLLTQVAIVEAMADAGQPGMACIQLTSLDLQIKAQESKRRIDRRDAAAIYAQTQQIRSVIGCGGSPS